MLPRAIFCDMDDTFLFTNKEVPAQNLAAIDALATRGVEFVPSSGRGLGAMPPEVVHHPAVRYVISSVGAVVTDVREGRTLLERFMSAQSILALYEAVRDVECTFDVFCGVSILCERERYDRLPMLGLDEPTLAVLQDMRTPFDGSLADVMRTQRVQKVSLWFRHVADQQRVARLAEADPRIAWAASHPQNIEMTDASSTKGTGMAWLCDHLGIDVADTMAFGDSGNDVTMLEAAGVGVAMGNAPDDVKAAADDVAGRNDDCGFATYVRALLA